MSFSEYIPHILTGTSLFLAIFLHWRTPSDYWRPSIVSGVLSALFAVTIIFVLQDNYLQLDSSSTSSVDWAIAVLAVAGLGFCYGLLIAMLIGYVIKIAPSFFD